MVLGTKTNPKHRARGAADLGRIGVITPQGVETLGRFHPGFVPTELVGAWELARNLDLRQMWWTPAAIEAAGLPASIGYKPEAHRFMASGRLRHSARQTHLKPWMSIWAEGDHFVELSFPSWESGSPFRECEVGAHLLSEVLEFTSATGMLWRRSGAITSDSWLRDHWGEKLEATEYPEIALDGNLEPDMHWHRPPAVGEGRARFCYAFDLNAMYLSAASSLALPYGEMKHFEPPQPLHPEMACGYWRYGKTWLTSPAASYHNAELPADETFMWTRSHRYLEPWYKALRQARMEILPSGNTPALEAVKQVYRQGVGRFGSTRRSIESDPLFQPYWRHAVMAEARTRLRRRIDSIDAAPIAVDVDCVWYLSSKSTPDRFAKAVGLPVGDGLGQFHFAGSAPAKAVRALIQNPSTVAVVPELRAVTV